MQAQPDLPILLIVGPTAGGKTSFSVELAKRLPGGGECINADSMQVYRDMDIGTAKPTMDERDGVAHHLLDIADPAESGFTVASWLQHASAAIEDVRERGHWPIVVGGTNLYVRSLLEGVFDGPAADPDVRAALEALSPGELRKRLLEVDPSAAERIHENDRRRSVRAIEVAMLTGRPISEQQVEWSAAIKGRDDVALVGLDWPVELINARINARVKTMIESGFLDEVRALVDADRLGPQAREAVGYRELAACLDGECSLEDAVEQIKIRTRRLGKQQRTWLRRLKSVPGGLWISPEGISSEEFSNLVCGWLDSQGFS
ncbi:MAG: tRNA (adenosine(37)-N6)-dimethylallyltransferase MiaA [Phycisphaerales bacterium]|nr:tRNA (adenosine(37)-N6)-dimethylallyltransferase MiaA [Phycisphaerales bacterium]